MDQLDRIYRTLVQTIRTSFPQYLAQPFEVAELYQTVLPYRHHRRTLGFDTNQDYEVALLELLAGERGYLLVEERMRDALRKELASPNPDPAAFRNFASSQVSLAHEPLRRIEAQLDAEAASATPEPGQPTASLSSSDGGGELSAETMSIEGGRSHATAPGGSSDVPRASTMSAQRSSASGGVSRVPTPRESDALDGVTAERGIVAAPGEDCRFCGGVLPGGRRLVFCPHCGQDLTVQHCLACGTELELGWRFCISCGRGVAAG